MSKPDGKWMSLEEAIMHVMRVRGVSRHKATEMLAKKAKQGKLGYTAKPVKSTLKPLSPEEAVEQLRDDPEHLFVMSLRDLMIRADIPSKELLEELRAGRLIASATDATFFRGTVDGSAHAGEFLLSAKALTNWMSNPKTPPHLLAKFQASLGRKPS